MAFDYIFKRVMRDLLRSCDAKPEKVGDLPLEIDTVASCTGTRPVTFTIPLLEQHFSTDNLLEYKSEGDKRRKESLSKLLGYAGLYCDQHGIGVGEIRSRLTTWYITAKRPAFLDALIDSNVVVPAGDAGVYEVIGVFPCPCRVVVCDELIVNDANIPLLVLGSESTIKVAIMHLARAGAGIRHTMETIISLIYLYYHDKVKGMNEMNEILPADVRQSMKHAIEDLGLYEDIIKEMGTSKVIDAVGVDKLIDAVGVDKFIDAVGVDKLIDAVGVDKVKQAIARREGKKKKTTSKSR